jgi:hypothetical protein
LILKFFGREEEARNAKAGGAIRRLSSPESCLSASVYALNELPQPQVDFTFGLLNLKPAPSSVST